MNYSAFLDASRLSNYTNYFSKMLIAVEQHVNEKTLFDHLIGYELMPGGWESLMTIKGVVQEEVLYVFWSNIHDSNLNDLTFHTEVCGVQMDLYPSHYPPYLG